MNAYDIEWGARDRRERHAVAVAAAAIVSTAVHLVVIYLVSVLNWEWPLRNTEREPVQHAGPIRLERVQAEATASEPVGESGGPGEGAGTWSQSLGGLQDLAAAAPELALGPNSVAIEPAPLPENALTGESGSTVEPAEFPRMRPWELRQEIVAIERRVARDEVPKLERRLIPQIQRVAGAPDIAVPMQLQLDALAEPLGAGASHGAAAATGGVTAAGMLFVPPAVRFGSGTGSGGPLAPVPVPTPGTAGKDLFEEVGLDITPVRPIEEFLKARVEVYSSLLDRSYSYFRMEISPARSDALPVIPKDVVLVQDSSNSMTEQRLYFCRLGLARCLDRVGEKDRFNVVSFQEAATFCFPDWQPRTPEAIEQAKGFSAALASAGNTDILASLQALRRLKSTPGRPMVVLLVTDGRSTTGRTDSTDIIGRFTRENEGAMSVYTLGTVSTANRFLLDLLSYCNRGDVQVVTRGRWDIPDAMERVIGEASQPVLADVRFRMADRSAFEVYPVLTSNLYVDRPIRLYGRFPRGQDRLIFQAVGQAGPTRNDMIFDLSMQFAERSSDSDIREQWARQKVYHLLGEYARTANTALLGETAKTAADYRIDVPYADKVGL
jgi:hypothetical protein